MGRTLRWAPEGWEREELWHIESKGKKGVVKIEALWMGKRKEQAESRLSPC